jgi:hypothetical protein
MWHESTTPRDQSIRPAAFEVAEKASSDLAIKYLPAQRRVLRIELGSW